jgi:uncharacterized protein YegL
MSFTIESFHNPYLPMGTTRVDAVLTVTASQDEGSESTFGGGSGLVIGIIVDTSGSMQGDRIEAVRHATRKAIALLRDGMFFFIIRFSSTASVVYPLSPATESHKARADQEVRRLDAGGSTAMSTGLDMAREQFQMATGAIHQALFLTDGKNDDNDNARLDAVLARCEGVFQCDCRGVGTDWQVKQLQKISSKLLGTAQIIAAPANMEADFASTIQNASGRTIGKVRLRLWTPKTARIVAVKQMSPEIVLLTDRGTPVDAQSTDYPTGAWSAESRDYYVAIEMSTPGEIGDEMLAARPSILYEVGGQVQEVKNPAARILASWTGDEALSARINPQVAHYTGQAELAQTIQEGLEARAKGDVETATRLLGRAAKLAVTSGNEETTSRLKKVVDIVDAREGTVRLKQKVNKADEMDLDLGSTRTSRARRPNPDA